MAISAAPFLYSKPEDIKMLGADLNAFVNMTTKSLMRRLKGANIDAAGIDQLIGESPINDPANDNGAFFPLPGRSQNITPRGLFGAFYLMHIPHRAFTQELPKRLGELGYKLRVITKDWQKDWPLDQVAVKTLPRTSRGYDRSTPGRIILARSLMDASGVEAVPAGKPLTSNHQSKEFCKFTSSGGEGFGYAIIGPDGKAVGDEKVATNFLWGQLGARGMKLIDNQLERTTLNVDGTDDDFNAERALIECLEYLNKVHHVDLMEFFNQKVHRQAQVIQGRDDIMQCLYAAYLLEQMAGPTYILPEIFRDQNIRIGVDQGFIDVMKSFGDYNGKQSIYAVANIVKRMGLKLPERLTDSRLRQLVNDMRQHADAAIQPMLEAALAAKLVRKHVAEMLQLLDMVDFKEWHDNQHVYNKLRSKINRLPEAYKTRVADGEVDPAEDVAARLGRPLPDKLTNPNLVALVADLQKYSLAVLKYTREHYLPKIHARLTQDLASAHDNLDCFSQDWFTEIDFRKAVREKVGKRIKRNVQLIAKLVGEESVAAAVRDAGKTRREYMSRKAVAEFMAAADGFEGVTASRMVIEAGEPHIAVMRQAAAATRSIAELFRAGAQTTFCRVALIRDIEAGIALVESLNSQKRPRHTQSTKNQRRAFRKMAELVRELEPIRGFVRVAGRLQHLPGAETVDLAQFMQHWEGPMQMEAVRHFVGLTQPTTGLAILKAA